MEEATLRVLVSPLYPVIERGVTDFSEEETECSRSAKSSLSLRTWVCRCRRLAVGLRGPSRVFRLAMLFAVYFFSCSMKISPSVVKRARWNV